MSNLTDALIAAKLVGGSGGSGGGSGSGGGLYIEYSAGMPSINATYNDIVNAISNGHSVYLARVIDGGRLLYSCIGYVGTQGNYMVIFVGVLEVDAGSASLRGEQLLFSSSTPDGLLAPKG